ncbi:MAG: hypothetical protein R3E92_05695 [Burkholderiaceae bacterium]
MLSIEDRPGIGDDERERVFERFVQVANDPQAAAADRACRSPGRSPSHGASSTLGTSARLGGLQASLPVFPPTRAA